MAENIIYSYRDRERVCVTGAGGYVASWVVKLLLSKGHYIVHGTVRDPCDEKKNAHLKKLEKAAENLQLFKADLLDYESLCAAIAGCTGVIHVASPVFLQGVPNPEVELFEPAVKGTRNILNACLKTKVNKVVVVSSVAAIMLNPSWPKDKAMDESCWTDIEHCRAIENWYCLGKTIAESEALGYAKRKELNLVTVCPSIVIGPMLQSTLNSSCALLLNFIKDSSDTMEDRDLSFIDVRDVAEAIILTYEKPEVEGRYICAPPVICLSVLMEKLKNMFPHYRYPTRLTEPKNSLTFNFTSEKLQNLGWQYRPLEETIVDAIKNFEDTDLLFKD